MIAPLNHAELIVKSRAYASILGPREIPVHPRVFECAFAYSVPFVKKVKEELPSYIRDDAQSIAAMLGIVIEVGALGIKFKDEQVSFNPSGFTIIADPENKSIDVICFETNMALDVRRRREHHERNLDSRQPLPREKRAEYSIQGDGNQHLVWYDHNMSLASLPLQLLFRNFAIAFNNLALKEL